jgi:hypothetical protein
MAAVGRDGHVRDWVGVFTGDHGDGETAVEGGQ